MKKFITRLMCGVLMSSFILCGCNQTTETGASSETESQTEATTTTAETEPVVTEAKPEIDVDNMIKVSDLYASKKSGENSPVNIYADGIRGEGSYFVSDGALYFCYTSLNNLSTIQIKIQSGKITANISYDFTYKDKKINGEGDASIANFEKCIDDIIAGTATYINVYDKSGYDEYFESFKKDLPIVYSRFIAMADIAFPELGLKLEDLGLNLGTKYRSVDPKQTTSMEPTVTHEHKFKNGFCTDCKVTWNAFYYDAVGKLGGMTGKGWRSVYGQNSSSMFAPGDYVQYAALNNKVASLMYYPATADKTNTAEDEMLFIEVENMSTKKKKQNLSVNMTFRLNMKKTQFSKTLYAPKYTYELTIKAKPGQYDKVFESKESLKKYATVNFYVANKKGFQSSAWGKKANISKLKASVEKDGCTYYTKDDIIDRLWEHHENLLTSIDKGMVWMNTSLADVGINWKKD
jgi:hypothetical protein